MHLPHDQHQVPCTGSNCSLRLVAHHLDATEMTLTEHTVNEQTIMIWICVIGYVISTILCLGSLYVFRHFKKLWCLRNLIHANFISCIACHNICWLFLALSLTLGLEICILTELLVEVTKFCVTSVFCWMLVEGCYLYLSILYCLHVHRIKFWMCASIGWGLPFALSTRGILHKMTSRDGSTLTSGCLDINESLDNLTVVVIILIIFTNAIILLAVIYVLFTKFRQLSDKEWSTLKHIFRALLFLCPLLGINYIATIYHPEHPQWLSTSVAFYSLVINAFQGTFISIFFCFNHEEVRACLRRSLIIGNQSSISTKANALQRKSFEESSQMTFLGP